LKKKYLLNIFYAFELLNFIILSRLEELWLRMNRSLILFAVSAALFSLTTSCKKYKPAPEAFFIKASTVSVAPTSTAQGTANHKITDLFLYVNGKFQGAYQPGNLLPIVTRGENTTIDVFAGIKENGIKDKTITWIFYDKIDFDTLVETGKTIDRAMTFKYNPNVTFAWVESFDSSVGYSLIRSPYPIGSDTMYKTSPGSPDNFEGKSAEIGLTGPDYKFAHFESSVPLSMPTGDANVYLELNYKCSREFEVGIYDAVSGKDRPALHINAHSDWNKIYIHLADVVNQSPVQNKYKIYFKVEKPNDVDEVHVWLDNIKLVYL
jgi:hypothetical protein